MLRTEVLVAGTLAQINWEKANATANRGRILFIRNPGAMLVAQTFSYLPVLIRNPKKEGKSMRYSCIDKRVHLIDL